MLLWTLFVGWDWVGWKSPSCAKSTVGAKKQATFWALWVVCSIASWVDIWCLKYPGGGGMGSAQDCLSAFIFPSNDSHQQIPTLRFRFQMMSRKIDRQVYISQTLALFFCSIFKQNRFQTCCYLKAPIKSFCLKLLGRYLRGANIRRRC